MMSSCMKIVIQNNSNPFLGIAPQEMDRTPDGTFIA